MPQEQTTVWDRPERGSRGPAAVRSRAELAAAAVQLADREGLAAVSMRQVAQALGTGQASLYRYVAGRDDLLDLMADAVVAEVGEEALTGDPVADLTALAVRVKELHLRHPWLVDLPPEPLRLGPRGVDHLEHVLAALAPVALPGPVKLQVVALVNAVVAQFARVELQVGAEGRGAAQAAYLVRAAEGHPHVRDALSGEVGVDASALFVDTVRRLLVGLLAPGFACGGPPQTHPFT
ncbi:TetR family transcriptional regulator [Streptomyces spiroverticillatus]|uniref:TetR family transcriptional regulator n=1 Tax=Streptomyces finlayi TaxID=67296 RepID=A0A919C9F8_9ACTN|nr:helix-turn-helix domain-containing protein [Streptomyces finlayi]GHA06745.1 TetR family transcriptional regulator [Streptomyces spiroverticillatus]GHC90222.1 TetR family transcriptional regulator [Streptomyces finlayi]